MNTGRGEWMIWYRTEENLEKQIDEMQDMFKDIVSYSKEFWLLFSQTWPDDFIISDFAVVFSEQTVFW